MPYIGETSVQLEKELRNFFQKYLKEFAQLSLVIPILVKHKGI